MDVGLRPPEACTLRDLNFDTWVEALLSRFQPCRIVPGTADPFVAQLQTWTFDGAYLASSRSSPAKYLRTSLVSEDDEESVIITFCLDVVVRLFYDGDERVYGPFQFMIYPANHPWNWENVTSGELWSLKLPAFLLVHRLGNIPKFERYAYNLDKGSGQLLLQLVRLFASHIEEGSTASLRGLRVAIVEILSVALEEHHKLAGGAKSLTQRSHLARIEKYIHDNLGKAVLTPRLIAEACNVSTRYLHEMFSASGTSVSRWILEQRLQGAYQTLSMPRCTQNISMVALQWGFSDHSHFSRHFKIRFRCTPREVANRFSKNTW